MKAPAFLVLTVLSLGLAAGDDKKPADKPAEPLPPVLRNTESLEDSVVVTLPGAPVPAAPASAEKTAPPAQEAAPSTVAPWPTAAAESAMPVPKAAATAESTTAAPPAAAESAAAAGTTPPSATAESAPPAAPAPTTHPAADDPAPAPVAPPTPAPEPAPPTNVAAAPASSTHAAVQPTIPDAPVEAPAPKAVVAPVVAPDPVPTPAPTPALPTASGKESPFAAASAPEPNTVPSPAAVGKPLLPEELRAESGLYCQKYIGKWRDSDARAIFGQPTGMRPSLDEEHQPNGVVLAFADPTGRYQQLELDFDKQSGRLRTVFAYPKNLTWTQCHRVWAGPVKASLANKGRRFYSYVDRKLDVLVDPAGKVISLGWY